MEALRLAWNRSKAFRALLIATAVYAVLRAGIQAAYLSGALLPDGYESASGVYVPADMQVYLDAARHLVQREALYLAGPLEQVEFFQYTPAFALLFVPFTWLSTGALIVVHSLIHVAAYAWLYVLWARLFRRLGLERPAHTLALALPVWLVFSSFWADWAYLNIYVVMAVLGTLLLEAVLDEELPRAALLLALTLQIKPQWAFAAAVPLFLGRFRFFARLLLLGAVGYAALAGLTMLAAGPAYVAEQYAAYVRFLFHLAANFPWRGPEAGFQGYNHSILQTLVFWMGATPAAFRLATGIKIALTVPLAVAGLWQAVLHPGEKPGRDMPERSLDLAFALYLAGFIWLDWVWELSLGPVIFTYLLGTAQRRGTSVWLAVVFLPLALLDLWQLVSVIAFGEGVVAGAYILSDPSIYVPLILIVILALYAVLLRRLLHSQESRLAFQPPMAAGGVGGNAI